MENVVTVPGYCFAVSVLNCLFPLDTSQLPIKYMYSHYFSANFNEV